MNWFSDMVGHGGVVDLLDAELSAPAHAYLFVGPANVGKATAARRFASALIAGADEGDFRRAKDGSHPDLIIVEPQGRTSITVEQARSIVSAAVRSPLEADRKVFLLEEASMLNDEAANALLKTIEEPIRTSAFVLVAESEDDLPATLASRCRTIVFGRLSESEIATGLVARGIDEEHARKAARISGGRPGLAFAFATEESVVDFRDAWLRVPDKLTGHPGDAYRLVASVLSATEPLLDAVKRRQEQEIRSHFQDDDVPKGVTDRQTRELARASDALYVTGLELLATFYRDTAAAQFGASVHNTDIAATSLTRVTSSAALVKAEQVLESIDSLRANQRPQLALAALFVKLGSDV